MLFHVVRSELQPGGDAAVVGQSRLGQALPGSVHATHDGGGVVAASTVLNMQFLLPLGWPVLNSIYRAIHVFSPGLTFLCAKFLEILDLIKFIYFLSWSLPKSVAYYFNYQS